MCVPRLPGILRRDAPSVGNLQHISEREPDDWEEDPSLHPTTETMFMEKSKQAIQSKQASACRIFLQREVLQRRFCGRDAVRLQATCLPFHDYVLATHLILHPPDIFSFPFQTVW